MLNLETADRQALVGLLQDAQPMQTEPERRQMLEYAGLQKVLPLIDLSGAPFFAANKIVSFLADFGQLTYGNEALGIFLNAMKSTVGVEQKEIIDNQLVKYNMMDPALTGASLADDDWKNTDDPATVQEKIIGINTLRPIAFLEEGLRVSRSVAQVRVRRGTKRWTGTGFMITPNLAMTNHHVVPEKDLLPNVLLRFNYQEDFLERPQETKDYKAVADGQFHENEDLDYAIFEIAEEPGRGDRWGHLPLKVQDLEEGNRINIIQHPNGLPKQISMQNNLVQYVGGDVVQYVTSTDRGASGSPVFNDNWEVVALHHAGGDLPEPTTKQRHIRNEGILLSRILSDNSLPTDIKQKIEAAASD